jgi:hypothetical protein
MEEVTMPKKRKSRPQQCRQHKSGLFTVERSKLKIGLSALPVLLSPWKEDEERLTISAFLTGTE